MATLSWRLFLVLLCLVTTVGIAFADSSGKENYLADCSRCHGVDGRGAVPQMRAVPGYLATDLTQLSKSKGGQFPRQEVYDAIDGRKRFSAHFIGDMPTWGLKYQHDKPSSESEEQVRRRISNLVDYIESLQEK